MAGGKVGNSKGGDEKRCDGGVRRRLFEFLAGTSAVLCLALSVLWVRSYFVEDVVTCEEPGALHMLWTGLGGSTDEPS
jgi:hypothetical protein